MEVAWLALEARVPWRRRGPLEARCSVWFRGPRVWGGAGVVGGLSASSRTEEPRPGGLVTAGTQGSSQEATLAMLAWHLLGRALSRMEMDSAYFISILPSAAFTRCLNESSLNQLTFAVTFKTIPFTTSQSNRC